MRVPVNCRSPQNKLARIGNPALQSKSSLARQTDSFRWQLISCINTSDRPPDYLDLDNLWIRHCWNTFVVPRTSPKSKLTGRYLQIRDISNLVKIFATDNIPVVCLRSTWFTVFPTRLRQFESKASIFICHLISIKSWTIFGVSVINSIHGTPWKR